MKGPAAPLPRPGRPPQPRQGPAQRNFYKNKEIKNPPSWLGCWFWFFGFLGEVFLPLFQLVPARGSAGAGENTPQGSAPATAAEQAGSIRSSLQPQAEQWKAKRLLVRSPSPTPRLLLPRPGEPRTREQRKAKEKKRLGNERKDSLLCSEEPRVPPSQIGPTSCHSPGGLSRAAFNYPKGSSRGAN